MKLVCEISHGMVKWFAQNTVRNYHGLEKTKRPLILLLLLFYKQKRDQLQIHTHSKKQAVNVQQPHVQQPSTYAKPEAASEVLGSL
jgi:hypothetical protein